MNPQTSFNVVSDCKTVFKMNGGFNETTPIFYYSNYSDATIGYEDSWFQTHFDNHIDNLIELYYKELQPLSATINTTIQTEKFIDKEALDKFNDVAVIYQKLLDIKSMHFRRNPGILQSTNDFHNACIEFLSLFDSSNKETTWNKFALTKSELDYNIFFYCLYGIFSYVESNPDDIALTLDYITDLMLENGIPPGSEETNISSDDQVYYRTNIDNLQSIYNFIETNYEYTTPEV